MTRWFTADLHLGHRNIIDYCNRPFQNTRHMNFTLAERWTEKVMPDDEVYVLGDLALGSIDDSLLVAKSLPGHKFLVPGNHDRCWPGGKSTWVTWIPRYEEAGFEVLLHSPGDTVPVGEFRTCHFPPTGEGRPGHEDRFSAWRPTDGPILHGHVHDAWKTKGEWINVGVDVWDYAPVSEETLSRQAQTL